MNFKQRIAELEKYFHSDDPIVAIFEDGSQQTIRLRPGEDVLNLYARVMNNPDCEEADLIRRSVRWVEPGGSKMLELANALLTRPQLSESEKLILDRSEGEVYVQ